MIFRLAIFGSFTGETGKAVEVYAPHYTVPGIGLRFFHFYLSTLDQRTNFPKLNA